MTQEIANSVASQINSVTDHIGDKLGGIVA